MTTRFLRACGTLAVALVVLAGCDSGAPDAAGPSAASAGSCPSPVAGIAGPDNILPSSSGFYTAEMKPGCVISNVLWSVTAGSATLVTSGPNNTNVTVSPSSGPVTIKARVYYDIDELAQATKTITYGVGTLVLTRTSATGNPVAFSWTPPAGAYSTSISRSATSGGSTTTSPGIGGGGYGTSSFTDNDFLYNPSGTHALSYTVTVINSAYQTIATGSISLRGNIYF